ncbi:glycosyltransferase [Singulisphaera sp. Ch08]|uniref:Glycosyltransferase n=1 Tax=Singulisphaera sp. Ch08 TaxID=3120278 RepID=A0AAU7CEQ1_9BACT
MASVSVFIPCYKYGHFLRQSVESVLEQTGVDVRVIILDDASPDDTPQVAGELVEQDRRVEYRRHTTNQGHIATYNEGIAWASGDYTLLLSADDLLTPGALARAARVMDDHPEVGMVYGRGLEFESDGPAPEPQATSDPAVWKIHTGAEVLESFCAAGYNLVCTPTAVVRTCLQKRLGGYLKELPHTGDMEMWMRFAAHADIAVLDGEQACYRRHASSMSTDWYKSPVAELMQRKAAFDSIFNDYSVRINDADRLRTSADRTLASATVWEARRAFDAGNLSCCRELLVYALEIDAELRDYTEWSRIAWKLRLGPKACAGLQPVIKLARKVRAIRFSQPGHHITPLTN